MTNTRLSEAEVVQQILTAYKLTATKIFPRQMGYRNRSYPALLNGGRWANVIIYKSDPDIQSRISNANYVSDYLAGRGLPVRQTLDPRIIQLRSKTHTKYAAVYNYLPGHTIPWEGYTMKHLKLLGWTLGSLHAELASLTCPHTMATATAEYLAISRRMQNYFSQTTVRHALSAKLGLKLDPAHLVHCDRLLHHCRQLPDQQILHLDFVRSNILFSDQAGAFQLGSAGISGILDFEKTAFGHPAFDLARTLAFLLVDCKYKPELKVRKYFLESGYSKCGRGSLPQPGLLEPLITLFLTYDFYKFLRHNPYESLPQNQHFVRTCTLLQNRKVVATTPALARFAAAPAKPV